LASLEEKRKRHRDYMKQWVRNHPHYYKEYMHRYYLANKDKRRQYKQTHRKEINERQKKYAKANPNEIKALRRKTYYKNREKNIRYTIDWMRRNPEKVKLNATRYRLTHPKQIHESFLRYRHGENAVRASDRDKTCRKCRCSSRLDIHHIDMDKNNNNLNNLILLCKDCHRKLHAFTIQQISTEQKINLLNRWLSK